MRNSILESAHLDSWNLEVAEEYPGICMYRGGRWRSHSRWHGRTPYGRAAGVQHGRTATTGVRHGGNGGGGEGGVAMRAGASEMSSGKRLSADAVTTRPWPRGLKTASSKPSARAPSPWACAVVVTCFQFLSVILVCAWWQNSGGNIVLVLGVLHAQLDTLPFEMLEDLGCLLIGQGGGG